MHNIGFTSNTCFWKQGTPHLVGVSLQVNYITGIDTVAQQFEAGFYISYEYIPNKGDIWTYKKAKAEGTLAEWIPEYVPQFNFPNVFEFIEKVQRQYLDGSYYSLVKNGEVDALGAKLPMRYEYVNLLNLDHTCFLFFYSFQCLILFPQYFAMPQKSL